MEVIKIYDDDFVLIVVFFFESYCFDCYELGDLEGGFVFDGIDKM